MTHKFYVDLDPKDPIIGSMGYGGGVQTKSSGYGLLSRK